MLLMLLKATKPHPRASRPWKSIVGFVVLAIGAAWLTLWLFDRREHLRIRLEIEQSGGQVEVVPGGPAWLRAVIDPRYFDRVVALRLNGDQPFNSNWLAAFEELETLWINGINLTEEDMAIIAALSELRSLNLIKSGLAGPEL
jgi:hypothetical protein